MASNQSEFQTPTTMASLRVPQAAPKKHRVSTPTTNITIPRLRSPMMSPISPVNRELQFDAANCSVTAEPSMADLSFTVSPKDTSFGMNRHLDLATILKEWKIDNLLPYFNSKGISLSQFSEMKEVDFLELGIFQLNDLDTLKKVCKFLNNQNNSY